MSKTARKIAYFPTDVLDGELTLPPATGHKPLRKVGDKTYYLPFDYNLVSQSRAGGYNYDPLGPSCWFTYGEGRNFTPSRPFPAEAVAKQIRLGWKRGAANVFLATAPDHTGRMRPRMLSSFGGSGGFFVARGRPCQSRFRKGAERRLRAYGRTSPNGHRKRR